MPKRRYLHLTEAQKMELKDIRDHHPKPYMREKAAALLMIADGMSPHAVAQKGLLVSRAPDTIYSWLDRFEAEGVQGLFVRKGRGRKPAFFP
jgi:transposase